MPLIAVYTSQGCVGRCDAKCYEAQDPVCDCICGGSNHGAGLTQAIENTRASAEAWIEKYAGAHQLTEGGTIAAVLVGEQAPVWTQRP